MARRRRGPAGRSGPAGAARPAAGAPPGRSSRPTGWPRGSTPPGHGPRIRLGRPGPHGRLVPRPGRPDRGRRPLPVLAVGHGVGARPGRRLRPGGRTGRRARRPPRRVRAVRAGDARVRRRLPRSPARPPRTSRSATTANPPGDRSGPTPPSHRVRRGHIEPGAAPDARTRRRSRGPREARCPGTRPAAMPRRFRGARGCPTRTRCSSTGPWCTAGRASRRAVGRPGGSGRRRRGARPGCRRRPPRPGSRTSRRRPTLRPRVEDESPWARDELADRSPHSTTSAPGPSAEESPVPCTRRPAGLGIAGHARAEVPRIPPGRDPAGPSHQRRP